MDDLLLVKILKSLCDLVDYSACIIVVESCTFVVNIRRQISSRYEVFNNIAREKDSVLEKGLRSYTHIVLSVWKTCSTLMMLG